MLTVFLKNLYENYNTNLLFNDEELSALKFIVNT